MPDVGDPGTSAVLLAWTRDVGDAVAEGDSLCLVSLSGAHAAVASSASGRLLRVLAGPGDELRGGMTLAEVELATEAREAVIELVTKPAEAPRETAEGSEAVDPARFRSPAVRRLAAEHGLDLATLPGSGRGGRVRREDVWARLAARSGSYER